MSAKQAEPRPRIAVTHDRKYKIGAYLKAVELAGGEAVAVKPGEHVSMNDFDALLLSGGVDVNPALYGQARHPHTEKPDRDRDEMEAQMLRQALAAGKPILAICRGLQFFNVAHGGTLHQHIDGHVQRVKDKAKPAHSVHIAGDSRLWQLLGSTETEVNSRHHQIVDRVGEGLVVSARSEEGIVEGLERTDRSFSVAVQWHPEDMAQADSRQRQLFEGFIAAARAVAR